MQKLVIGSLLLAACDEQAPSSIPPSGAVDPAGLAGRAWRVSEGSFRGVDLGELLARTDSSVLLRVNRADDTSFAFDLVLEGPGPDRACVLVSDEGSLDPRSGVGRWRSGTDPTERSLELAWGPRASEIQAHLGMAERSAACADGVDDTCQGEAGTDVRLDEVEWVPPTELPDCEVQQASHDDDDDDDDDDHPLIDVLNDVEIKIDVSEGEIVITCSSIGQRGGTVMLVALSLAGLVARRRRA